MPVPLKVEATWADPVEAREWCVELFAGILGKAGAIALNEAVARAMPFAADVDRIVEPRWANDGKEPRLQDFIDQPLTGGGDGGLLDLG